jgi:hypothetical protein
MISRGLLLADRSRSSIDPLEWHQRRAIQQPQQDERADVARGIESKVKPAAGGG